MVECKMISNLTNATCEKSIKFLISIITIKKKLRKQIFSQFYLIVIKTHTQKYTNKTHIPNGFWFPKLSP